MPKPPFPCPSVSPDSTPISSLTRMNRRQWEFWLGQGGKESYASRFPQETARILDGIVNGVAVDFVGDRTKPWSAPNHPIEEKWKEKINKVIADDVEALKKAGPFDRPPFEYFFVSPIGAVPKKTPGAVRMIHDLSSGDEESVNGGILHEDMSLSSFGHAVRAVVKLGKGCFLVKLDVEAAYKQVPVRPEDWHLLGFQWQGKWYYERVLPFGLRSSCRLWELFATALHHILERLPNLKFVKIVIHYVDDFLFVVKLEEDARAFLHGAERVCKLLGIPMAADKREGPSTCLTFLGIELDTIDMEARLPIPKLREIHELCERWVKEERATVRELQALHGKLRFACQVVRPGRFYLRRLIDHTTALTFQHPTKHLQKVARGVLPQGVREDIQWWVDFLPTWNGKSILYALEWVKAELIDLTTDACQTGFGGMYRSEWIAGRWSPSELQCAFIVEQLSMPFLEMRSLLKAAAAWGSQWAGKKITFRCDCMPVVHAITSGSSPAPALMHQLRELCALAIRYSFDFRSEHIPGVENTAADILSRDGASSQFRALFPNANPHPAANPRPPLPPPLLQPRPTRESASTSTTRSRRTLAEPTQLRRRDGEASASRRDGRPSRSPPSVQRLGSPTSLTRRN